MELHWKALGRAGALLAGHAITLGQGPGTGGTRHGRGGRGGALGRCGRLCSIHKPEWLFPKSGAPVWERLCCGS